MKMEKSVLLVLLLAIVTGAFSQTASVQNVWVTEGQQEVVIHTKFTVKGMKGKKIKVLAYFYDEHKKAMMGVKKGYLTASNHACAMSYLTPSYDNTTFNDCKVHVPKDALSYSKTRNTCYVRVSIYDENLKKFLYTTSSYYLFKITPTASVSKPAASGSAAATAYQSTQPAKPKTKRVYDNNGGYTDYTEEADGTTVALSHLKCVACNGTGTCNKCVNGQVVLYGYIVPCANCHGLKRCGFCLGNRYLVMRSETRNGVTTTYDSRGNVNTSVSGSANVSGPTNNNAGSNNSPNFRMVACTVCNATGLIPITTYDVSYWKENIPVIVCKQCGRRHKSDDGHERCGACGGTGKRERYGD